VDIWQPAEAEEEEADEEEVVAPYVVVSEFSPADILCPFHKASRSFRSF